MTTTPPPQLPVNPGTLRRGLRLGAWVILGVAIAVGYCWAVSSFLDWLMQDKTVAEAGAPIPVSANSYTWHDYDKRHLDWCQRHVLAPFDEVVKSQPWKTDATKFLKEVVPFWLHAAKRAPVRLCEQGQKLLTAGCDDPLVRYFTYWLERACFDPESQRDYRDYEKVLRQIEKETRYPRAMACFVAVDFGYYARLRDSSASRSEKMKALDRQIISLIRESLEEGSYEGADDMIFVQHALHFYENRGLNRLNDDLAALYASSPKLPAWARHTLLGYIEVKRAWKDRGRGWANQVARKGWAGFAEHLKTARAELMESWKLRPDRPEAASEMITVVMAGQGPPGDGLRLWFDRAVKSQFDYLPAYRRLEWALQPRWGGSVDALFAFGHACVATKRYDTAVPDYFFELVRETTLDLEDNRDRYLQPQVAADVMALDQTLLAAPERKDEVQDRLSFIMIHGWLCHRYDEARKALDRLNGKPTSCIKTDLSFFGLSENAILGDVYIFSSAAKDDYEKARALAKARDYAEAVQHYEAALKKYTGPEIGLRTLRIGMNISVGDDKLAGGGWVNISPKAGNLAEGWNWHYGKWEALPGGVLQIRANNERVLVASQLHVGTNFEVRADFEIDAPTDTGQALGVVLGYSRTEARDWLMCELWNDKQAGTCQATLLHGFYLVDNPQFSVTLEKKNHLHVQCWNNQITFYLNGKLVFKDMVSKKGSVGGRYPKFGFGAHSVNRRNTTRISNIEVRLLKEPPKPPE